jgi:hypothetical protein
LEDLDKIDVLEPYNAFTLQSRGHVKRMLDDYQGTLEDMDKTNVLEPNNAFTLKWHGDVKRILKDFEKVDAFEPNNVFTLCQNPTLAKCGGEAQHLEKLGICSPPRLLNVQS